MVSAIGGALGGVMAGAPLLPAQSPPLNATDPENRLRITGAGYVPTRDGWQKDERVSPFRSRNRDR